MKKILWILVIIAASCTNHKKQTGFISSNLQQIDIEMALDNRNENEQSLAKFMDTIQYIPLETGPNCNIEEIQQIIYYKNNLYIWDNSILKFDSNG